LPRVGNGAAQHFRNVLGGALLGVLQSLQRLGRFLPANQIHHQPRLLRRHAHVPREGVRFDRSRNDLRFSHGL